MPDNVHSGHRARLRERFEREGLEGFKPHEALELLLFYAVPRRNTNDLAHALLERFGSIDRVFDAGTEALCSVPGIGYNTAVFLRLMRPMAQYYLNARFGERKALDSTEAVGLYMCSKIGLMDKEVFAAAAFDAGRRERAFEIISEGFITQATVSLRSLAEFAIRAKAETVVIAHNHVYGGVKPSQANRDATRRICTRLLEIGVKVSDHIIVSGDDYFSFAENGIMPI